MSDENQADELHDFLLDLERGDADDNDILAFQRDCEERLRNDAATSKPESANPHQQQQQRQQQQQVVDTARQAAAAAASTLPSSWDSTWCSTGNQQNLTAKAEQTFHHKLGPTASAYSPQNMGSNSSDTNCTVPDLGLATATSAGHISSYAAVPQFYQLPLYSPAMGLPPLLGGVLPQYTHLLPSMVFTSEFVVSTTLSCGT